MNAVLDIVASEAPAGTALNALLDELRLRRDEMHRLGHIPLDIVEQFKEVGVYRAFVPERFGGSGMSVVDFLKLIEAISSADGSAGWVASFGFSSKYLSSLPLETLEEIYADGPDVVFSGTVYPPQPVTHADGGVIVNGRWGFGSGCMGASLIGAGIKMSDQPGGLPYMAVMPRSKVRIEENWDTIGMFATGSHDVVVEDVFVPTSWTHVRGGTPSVDSVAFRYPSIALAAQVLAVCGSGIAREAIREVTLLAEGKNSITGAPLMTNRPTFQIALAKMEAQLSGARSWFFEKSEEVWAKCAIDAEITAQDKIHLRLASTQIAQVGAQVARMAFELAGTTAIFRGHPLSRHMLDAMIVGQHAFLNENTWQQGGIAMVGQQTAPGYP